MEKKYEIHIAHIICLMYKLISSSKDRDDLSISFHRDVTTREKELTNGKETRGNYRVTFYLKDGFGFAEHQENAIYGLGYKLTLQRNSDNHVLSRRSGTDAENDALAGRVLIEEISWNVPLQIYHKINIRAYCI